MSSGIESSKTQGQDEGAHRNFAFRIGLGKVHRSGGAELLAGSTGALHKMEANVSINGILQGNCLGVKNIRGFSETKSQVKGIGHLDFTFLGTQAAGNTFIRVNVTGPPLQLHVKPTRLSGYPGDFREGVELDVVMPADLDQLGRQNSHGAVIGGKGLIQLRHGPADGRLLFHQMYKIAGVGQIQGGLHAGDAAAHYHYRSEHLSVHKAPL
jgi:hypothetical protein